MNCKNCKYWTRNVNPIDSKFGDCEKIVADKNGLQAYSWSGDASFDTGEDFGCIHFQEQESKKCKHKKIYDKELLMSNPPKQKWTCSKCGEKGIDMVVYSSLASADEYSKTISTSKSRLTLGDGEISLKVTKEELDDLRDRVKKYEFTITDNTSEIVQTVSKTEFRK
ncbi:hypothetical protein [Priestia megaterium]|uniref:hypothetical protein n=1 Tax=Priestia megaterium TaxID=1404 RepID=UPI00287728A8|nr:hypothetical protein [Priestia megaterium]